MQDDKGDRGRHVLPGLQGLEANKRDLHGEQQSERVEYRERDVEIPGIALEDEQSQHVQRNEVDNVDVSSPGRHHIEIAHRAQDAPECGSGFQGLDPEIEREEHCKDSYAFIVITARRTSADVTRHWNTNRHDMVLSILLVNDRHYQ